MFFNANLGLENPEMVVLLDWDVPICTQQASTGLKWMNQKWMKKMIMDWSRMELSGKKEWIGLDRNEELEQN